MNGEHEFIIEPNRSWFRVPLRDVLRYRDLLFLLVRRNFVATYKQTILGPAWYIIRPVTTTLVFTVVFGKIAKIPTDGLPKLLFYLCGTLAWGYFARCVGGTASTFVGNASLFGKVYFPRLVVPVSVVITNLIAFAIQFATFLGFWTYYKVFLGSPIQMRPVVLFFPLLLAQSAAIALGVGLWLSSLTAKYRDFRYLTGFLTSLWMYATPVVYPLSRVPEKWRWVSAINPMTGIVEFYRYGFLGVGTVVPLYLLISVGTTVILLISGAMVFNRTERTFIDTV